MNTCAVTWPVPGTGQGRCSQQPLTLPGSHYVPGRILRAPPCYLMRSSNTFNKPCCVPRFSEDLTQLWGGWAGEDQAPAQSTGTGGQGGASRKPQCICPLKGQLSESSVEAATSEGATVTASDQHTLLRMMTSSWLPLSKSHIILLLADPNSAPHKKGNSGKCRSPPWPAKSTEPSPAQTVIPGITSWSELRGSGVGLPNMLPISPSPVNGNPLPGKTPFLSLAFKTVPSGSCFSSPSPTRLYPPGSHHPPNAQCPSRHHNLA